MAINFPAWVTDNSQVPSALKVRCKKLVYAFAAAEKLRRLGNAARAWFRKPWVDHPNEVLTDEECDLLAGEFPGQWPTRPTEEQVDAYIDNVHMPRHHAAVQQAASFRKNVSATELGYVDINNLI